LSKPQIFIDLDGVLADFDGLASIIFGMIPQEFEDKYGSEAFWKKLQDFGPFFTSLRLMPDALDLWDFCEPYNPIILTGCPRGKWAQPQKIKWVKDKLNTDRIITCLSKEKRNFAKQGDILIDDFLKYQHLWLEIGDFIHHTSAENSIEELKKRGFE